MRQKILIISTSRADYGILENLIFELIKKKNFDVFLGITKSHFSKKFGFTELKFQKNFNNKIIKFDKINLKNDKIDTILSNILSVFNSTTKILKKKKFDKLIVLGDRYELIGFCLPFYFKKIPIIHLHGGEETKGAYDNKIRKIISIISSFHFVSHSRYEKNLKKMLNYKKDIYNFGSLGAENIEKFKDSETKKNIEKKFNIRFSKENILVCIHPETNNLKSHKENVDSLFKFLEKIKYYNIFFTSPGHDAGSDYIISKIRYFTKKFKNSFYVKSFGKNYYFSVLNKCKCLIGNSSSGIIEASSFQIPVINIGVRQKGREQSKNTVNADYNETDILKKFKFVMSKKFLNSLKKVKNIYFKKDTKKKIINIIENGK